MTEHATSGSEENANPRPQRDWFCKWLREGAEKLAGSLSPPEGAAKHFREARLEMLRGVRELIDHRIHNLSKETGRGSRIVVE